MSYPSYPELKDSGFEWLGEIPKHWEAIRLKFLQREPLMYGANESAEFDNPDWPRYIRITDMNDGGTLKDETFRSLPEEIAAPYLLEDGDFLFARSGATVGKAFMYSGKWGRACFAGYLIRFSPKKEKILPDFLKHYLRSFVYEDFVGESTIQATIQNVSAERYASLLIPFPKLEEQQSIATFLDRKTVELDELIRLKERQIELLGAKRQALISHAVTRGLDPSVKLRPSGIEWLGEIPAHWEVTRLKFIAQLQTGLTLGKEYKDRETVSRPYLRVANVQDGFLDLETITTISVPEEEAAKCELKVGDVLMTEGGDLDKLGRGYVWAGQIESCLHQNHIFAVRPDQTRLDSFYLSYTMASWYGKNYFTSTGQQTTNLATTNSTKLMNFPLLLPSLQEQKTVIERLGRETQDIDKMMETMRLQLDQLREYRQALISAAVTGKIDVRGVSV